MSRNTKTAIKAIAGFILAVALIFMVVSLSLASAHDRPLVDEWKSWVQEEEVQETPEDNTTEDQETDDIVDGELSGQGDLTDIEQVEDYSDIEIVEKKKKN